MTNLQTLEAAPLASTGLTAPPDGRMWRLATCWRNTLTNRSTILGELSDAFSRKVHFDLYGACTAMCSIDGRSPQVAAINELSQDLVMWRWDARNGGGYNCLFRGPIGQTEDSISETTHTVNIAAADYRAMLGRLIINRPLTYSQVDQATMMGDMIWPYQAGSVPVAFDLGIEWMGVLDPTGQHQTWTSGIKRDRTYVGSEKVGDMLDNLSQVISGFDYSCEPSDPDLYAQQFSALAYMWFPQRGIAKSFVAEYGVTVTSLTRTVNSTDFTDWVRVDGQPDVNGNAVFATSYSDQYVNPQLHPEGLWMTQQAAADVSVTTTLQQQADGYIAYHSQPTPSYTLQLIPGAWVSPTDCWLGDSIELRVASGRLNVDTSVRVVAVDIDINDNGQERVALTVARSEVDFSDIMAAQRTRLDALSRR